MEVKDEIFSAKKDAIKQIKTETVFVECFLKHK